MAIGFRDKNGFANHLSPLSIFDIERKAVNRPLVSIMDDYRLSFQETWTRESFLNFFVRFTDFVKSQVTEEYSPTKK
jgi:hypothetical protein